MARLTLHHLALIIFGFLIHFPAAGPVFASPQRQISRIINGAPVSTKNSPIVQVLRKQGDNLFLCTGSILSPRAILTAAHCVSRQAKNMTVVIDRRRFAVRAVKIAPNVQRDPTTGITLDDVSILTLSKATKKPRQSLLISREPQIGDIITILGYGLDESGRPGRLRQGSMALAGVSKDFLLTVFVGSQSDPCNGDSGGPAIASFRDNSGVLHSGIIGTVSVGSSSTCSPGDQTIYINVQSPSVLKFIQDSVPNVGLQ